MIPEVLVGVLGAGTGAAATGFVLALRGRRSGQSGRGREKVTHPAIVRAMGRVRRVLVLDHSALAAKVAVLDSLSMCEKASVSSCTPVLVSAADSLRSTMTEGTTDGAMRAIQDLLMIMSSAMREMGVDYHALRDAAAESEDILVLRQPESLTFSEYVPELRARKKAARARLEQRNARALERGPAGEPEETKSVGPNIGVLKADVIGVCRAPAHAFLVEVLSAWERGDRAITLPVATGVARAWSDNPDRAEDIMKSAWGGHPHSQSM